MKSSKEYLLKSEDEWERVVSDCIPLLKSHNVVTLQGDLGTGKTTFVKAVCDKLGVKEAITSPTYSIIQEYLTENGDRIYHIDLYRLNNYDELLEIGIYELLEEEDFYAAFIEWPELIQDKLLKSYLSYSIQLENLSDRKVQMNIMGKS